MQNNWNRWYDPQLRRWTSEDLIGFAGADGNTTRYCLNRSTVESDANGLSFWSDYWHYLSNPWDMDDDLETGFYCAAGTAVVAGAAAGGVAAAGYGAVTVTAAPKAAVPVVVSELADTAVEEGLSPVTGVPVVLPVSAVDAVQDLGKMALKKAAREAVENATESAAKRLAPKGIAQGAAELEDILVRRGMSRESARRLAKQAEAAEKAGNAQNGVPYGHGVSVTTPESSALLSRDPADAVSATRRALEDAGFEVRHTPTRADPNHHTVQLPKPVSDAVADLFNRIFGR